MLLPNLSDAIRVSQNRFQARRSGLAPRGGRFLSNADWSGAERQLPREQPQQQQPPPPQAPQAPNRFTINNRINSSPPAYQRPATFASTFGNPVGGVTKVGVPYGGRTGLSSVDQWAPHGAAGGPHIGGQMDDEGAPPMSGLSPDYGSYGPQSTGSLGQIRRGGPMSYMGRNNQQQPHQSDPWNQGDDSYYDKFFARRRGGPIPGTGSGDKVPVLAEPGEFMVRKAAARALGPDMMHKINHADKKPMKMRAGGYVYRRPRQNRNADDYFARNSNLEQFHASNQLDPVTGMKLNPSSYDIGQKRAQLARDGEWDALDRFNNYYAARASGDPRAMSQARDSIMSFRAYRQAQQQQAQQPPQNAPQSPPSEPLPPGLDGAGVMLGNAFRQFQAQRQQPQQLPDSTNPVPHSPYERTTGSIRFPQAQAAPDNYPITRTLPALVNDIDSAIGTSKGATQDVRDTLDDINWKYHPPVATAAIQPDEPRMERVVMPTLNLTPSSGTPGGYRNAYKVRPNPEPTRDWVGKAGSRSIADSIRGGGKFRNPYLANR